MNKIFLGLPDLTIVQNPHAHLCKSWKQLHYRMCWVRLFAHSSVQKHNTIPNLTSRWHSQVKFIGKWTTEVSLHITEFEVWTSVVRVYWFWYILSQGYISTHFSPIRLGFGHKNLFIILGRGLACG
jgi:hypothetical protein